MFDFGLLNGFYAESDGFSKDIFDCIAALYL